MSKLKQMESNRDAAEKELIELVEEDQRFLWLKPFVEWLQSKHPKGENK